ncbi:MAG: universal stress protein [Pseudonocardiales bacterium]|nr:universal stress protein [Actinomycetota bacterium]
MRNDPSGAVVVGVDGSTAAAKALEWAADEAERRGVALVIAYAGHLASRAVLAEGTARSALQEICAYGKEVLEDAMATALEDRRLVDVTTDLREVDPADMLIELSETASALVVGRGNEGPITRFVFGSITQRVAAHAHCPVVVVGPDAPLRNSQTVAVGVSDSESGTRAMRFACAEALVRHANVRAVRSWTELNWARPGFPFPPEASFTSLQDGEQAILDKCVRAARDAYPGLKIEGLLTEQPAYVALETAADAADLLVVGCRREEGSHLPRLGPLASWLLHHSRCPVAIVGRSTAVATAEEKAVATAQVLDTSIAQFATS